MGNGRLIFIILWVGLILIGPITVFRNTSLELALSNQTMTLNFFQRIVGLLAFSLIAWQIILGAFMDRWIQKLGPWVLKFHFMEGALIYTLVLLHPLLFVLFNFKLMGKLDPFYVFTDICVLCQKPIEYFYTFARTAFWLITVAVVAAKFRTHPSLRLHWRKFHILNYVVFYLIALHSWFVGSDIQTVPFIWFYWLAVVAISLTVFYKLFGFFRG